MNALRDALPLTTRPPSRFLRRTIERTKIGVAAAAGRLRELVAVFSGELTAVRERYPTLVSEIVATAVHHLIIAVIEGFIGWLVRRTTMRSTSAKVLSFPTLRPAT
jgi:hypothetical protein